MGLFDDYSSGFNTDIYKRKSSPNAFDQKFNTPAFPSFGKTYGKTGSFLGGEQIDFGEYSDIFTPKKKETDNFLKDFLKRKKPDEDSTAAKIAKGIQKSYRPEEKSPQDKIAEMLASRMGLGGGSGVQDVAQGLTLTNQGGGLQQPIVVAGKEGSGGVGGAIQGAAGGYLSAGPIGAVVGGIGGLFCDVRVKEDIAPLQKSEVNDLLSECAFFVKDLNECS